MVLNDFNGLPPFVAVSPVFCFLASAAAAVCACDVFFLFGFGLHLALITVFVSRWPENGSATSNNLIDIH